MVICIGREFGSGGHETGKLISEKLGIPFYDKDFIEAAEKISGVSADILEKSDERHQNRWLYSVHYDAAEEFRGLSAAEILFKVQSSLILEYAQSPCVIVGRCADFILSDAGIEHLSFFITAPTSEKVKRIMNLRSVSEKEAASMIARTDKQRKAYYEFYTNRSWGKPANYDFCINSSAFGTEKTADIIKNIYLEIIGDK